MSDPALVDNSIFQYNVQLVVNGNGRSSIDTLDHPDFISTILLSDSLAEDSSLHLQWNAYNGWKNPLYYMQWSKVDASDPNNPLFNWTDLDSLFEKSQNRLYTHNLEEVSEQNQGLYAMRILAIDTADATYQSLSNYIYYNIEFNPVYPVNPNIPNVFTPNGDNQNDRFYILPGEGSFSRMSLTVYNRWGNLVFEDRHFESRNDPKHGWDGTDHNTGNQVPDGVYYYIITLTDAADQNQMEFKGNVTVFGN